MSYPRQIIPGRVYLVTRRCTQRQFLLRPDDETNNAFIYCLAYAADRSGIQIVAFMANSNHYHAVVVDVEGRIPEFLEGFHKLLAKHQNSLRGRWENFWSSEQTSLVELVDAADVLSKVLYTVCNPVKDHLVERADDWPGATSLQPTLTGEPISATRPRQFFRANGFMPRAVTLRLIRAPGFDGLTDHEYAALLKEAIARAEDDAAAERRRTGRRVLGRAVVLAQSPTDSPTSREPRRELKPEVAARDKEPRAEAVQRLKTFRDIYYGIRDAWLRGSEVVFPWGTWWLRRFAAVPCEAG